MPDHANIHHNAATVKQRVDASQAAFEAGNSADPAQVHVGVFQGDLGRVA